MRSNKIAIYLLIVFLDSDDINCLEVGDKPRLDAELPNNLNFLVGKINAFCIISSVVSIIGDIVDEHEQVFHKIS